jgi:hypothetical protein
MSKRKTESVNPIIPEAYRELHPAMPTQMPRSKSGDKPRRNAGGRPRSRLPDELAAQLGPAPLNQPLALARWFTNAIAILTQLVLEGKPFTSMLETVRASAGAAGRVIPHDIVFEAHRILKADGDFLKSSGVKPVKRSDAPLRSDVSAAVSRIAAEDEADAASATERPKSRAWRRNPD